MKRLLSLFPDYCALDAFARAAQDAYQSEIAKSDDLAAKLQGAESERDRALADAEYFRKQAENWQAKHEAEHSAHLVTRDHFEDWMAQRMFGYRIHSHVPELPERNTEPQAVPRRRRAGELRHEATDAYREKVAEFYKREQDAFLKRPQAEVNEQPA